MRFGSTALADLLLLVVAFIWGTSYAVVKSALLVYPVLGLLALRFGITFVVLSPTLRSLVDLPRLQKFNVAGTGCVLLGVFLAETFGVQWTNASNAAFLISLCVVMTPLVEWGWLKRSPRIVEWVAAGLSLAGAFLIGGGRLDFGMGDALIVLAAFLRAINVCATKRVMRDSGVSPLTMTAVLWGVVSMGCVVLAATMARAQWQPLPSLAGHAGFWGAVLYLVVGCTLLAFFAQNHAVRRSSPTRVALLMGSEPVFGAWFACAWLGETLSLAAWMGGGLIVFASIIASVGGKGTPKRDNRRNIETLERGASS